MTEVVLQPRNRFCLYLRSQKKKVVAPSSAIFSSALGIRFLPHSTNASSGLLDSDLIKCCCCPFDWSVDRGTRSDRRDLKGRKRRRQIIAKLLSGRPTLANESKWTRSSAARDRHGGLAELKKICPELHWSIISGCEILGPGTNGRRSGSQKFMASIIQLPRRK